MSWARIDDRFHEHYKVIAAGPEAVGVWVMALTWAQQARRTTPHPGVVPDAVFARFAGERKARKVVARLREVGLLDDKIDAGWPIHDFADYLAKHDPEQAREAGRRGGQARAAKRTASEPPSEPLGETEAEAKRTSSTRASARRNPVPVPSVPKGTGRPSRPDDDSDGAPTAQTVVADWIDRQPRKPAQQVVSQVARHIKSLLSEDFTVAQIHTGLTVLDAKKLNPSTLPSLVTAAANDEAQQADVSRIPPWERFADNGRSIPSWEIQ
jgi:hypothetical protein